MEKYIMHHIYLNILFTYNKFVVILHIFIRERKIIMNNVFKFFKEISNIPRQSGKEEKISKYIVDFAIKRNLKYIHDNFVMDNLYMFHYFQYQNQ